MDHRLVVAHLYPAAAHRTRLPHLAAIDPCSKKKFNYFAPMVRRTFRLYGSRQDRIGTRTGSET
ncbi:hypothetical protein LXA47_31690 [Massilia sp. P8910]|nr:hypothetical protein [Massilia antarctica]